ncbi:MAG TPA: DUF305 domain-containing protein [Actinophytocola sp.]|uniref:DUF305 domain-containing protein n=1 Tax=Actinophytocola sp. TaxID=1872138 RepID=UPI002DB6B044|nr:DUF305 domain-containing protein [Actinophytocola sp.]HEU5472881.1 DUF305 domain-containing protein [Actinophytocola sp.]
MTWRRLAGAVAAVLVVAACTSPPDEEHAPVIAPGRPGEPASTIPPDRVSPIPAVPPNDADLAYVRNMIVHHHQAVEMARLVPDRAVNDTVKRLAERIGAAQPAEIDGMNAWLRRHDQPTIDPEHGGHTGHGDMPGMATPAQLEALRAATGSAFDNEFLELMIAHHQGALTMAYAIQTTGAEVRVQEMADDVIATQTDEINQMRALLGR